MFYIIVLPIYCVAILFSGFSSNKYKNIKKQASKVVYIQKTYSSGCYYKRNRHLVDFSSVCVCYQYKSTGGTAYTVKYAAEKGLKIIKL